jgi:hypothetical protein
MFKISFVLAVLIVTGFILSGCSKKTEDKIIGKWHSTEFEDTTFKSMDIKIGYEFTKDKIINTGTVHGDTLPTMEIPYIIKPDSAGVNRGDTLVLEATHPQSQQKGDFKITFDGDKMKLIDPGLTKMTLEKH